jgi:hypothetical protein
MNLKRATLPTVLVLAALVGAGVGATFTPPYEGVEPPTPTVTAPPFVLPEPLLAAATCTEDEPCWDCETMGNHICGTMDEGLKAAAWAEWDAAGGAGQLLVDTHARVTLTGYTWDDPYGPGVPELAANQLALAKDGRWFIFTADSI